MIPTVDERDHVGVDSENNEMIENETFPEALAPTPTPRSPEPVVEVKRPQRRYDRLLQYLFYLYYY